MFSKATLATRGQAQGRKQGQTIELKHRATGPQWESRCNWSKQKSPQVQ